MWIKICFKKKKKKKMNCEEVKEKINIRMVLESFNLFSQSKKNRKKAFYFALDREEKNSEFIR